MCDLMLTNSYIIESKILMAVFRPSYIQVDVNMLMYLSMIISFVSLCGFNVTFVLHFKLH